MGSLMSRGAAILLLVTLVLPLLLASPASAEVYEDELWIAAGGYHEVGIDHNTTDLGWLHYWIDVLSGPAINVWLVDDEGWERYLDPGSDTFPYYEDYSYQDTRQVFEMGFDILDEGTYHIIIENTDDEFGDATHVHYRLTHGVEEETLYSDPAFFGIVCAVVLALLVIVFFNLYVRWKETPERRQGEDPVEFMRRQQGDGTSSRPVEAEAPKVAEGASAVEPVSTRAGPPRPPPVYSHEVVRESMRQLGHGDDREEKEGGGDGEE